MTSITKQSPYRFELFFRQDGDGPVGGKPRYRIQGSGVKTQPMHATRTHAVVQFLQSRDIAVAHRSSDSPANANSYYLDAAFLDGGLHARTGNYWLEPRGAWIEGEDAVSWIAHGLGLRPPGSLRVAHVPKLTARLAAAYTATDFVVLGLPEIHVTVGLPTPPPLIQLMAASSAKSAAIITAWNPFSSPLSDAENRLRQNQLLHDLRGQHLKTLTAEGRDRQGVWPAEASLLALGLPHRSACELLERYQQHALVWLSSDAPARLLYHPTHTQQTS